jgi:hypothetical protein
MTLKPTFGFDQLLFGMKQKNVEAIYGKASSSFTDEEGNLILLYNHLKARLTFYEDEDFRLGYIICSHPDALLFEQKVIGKSFSEVKNLLITNGYKSFEEETFDCFINYFNEDFWTILQTEFDEVIKVEVGAIVKNQDEFDWKFKA